MPYYRVQYRYCGGTNEAKIRASSLEKALRIYEACESALAEWSLIDIVEIAERDSYALCSLTDSLFMREVYSLQRAGHGKSRGLT